MRYVTIFLAVFLVGLMGPLLALATAKPQAGEIVLVVGPDPVANEAAVLNAGGRLIGPENARFGVLALGEEDGFVDALRAQDVWFVVDGRRVALLCGIEV